MFVIIQFYIENEKLIPRKQRVPVLALLRISLELDPKK